MVNLPGPLRVGPALLLVLLLVCAEPVGAQDAAAEKPIKQEELDQLLAPLALYPDSLLAQILMASTYPLEVVQARRWVDANKSLEGDARATALEEQPWDPSVKSLVDFPQVLEMMDEKLEWTHKLGDAFLAQQKEVMDTIQQLRKKAEGEGNLETTKEQTVIVEKETQTIVIQSADPKVVYVPTYNPTVVYGTWSYPAYPPYAYYPPGYAAGAALVGFGVGVAVGAGSNYAWGSCGWGSGDIDIDMNRIDFSNNNINRSKYADRVTGGAGGRGSWKHDPEHRRGTSYRDEATANRFDRGASRDAQSREAFRGRAETGREGLARGEASQFRDRSSTRRQDAGGRTGLGSSRESASRQRTGTSGASRTGTSGASRQGSTRRTSQNAFGGYERGSQTRSNSSRGRESLSSSRSGGGRSRSGGGFSGGGRSRSGGGFSGGRSSGGGRRR